MPLIDFLRITNQEGCIQRKLQKRWNIATTAGETTDPLETWACAQPLRGETLIAAVYLSRYNDEYYGQWVLMNRPFQNMDEMWREEMNLVPDHLYYQTMAYLLCPETWCDEKVVRDHLQLEAFRGYHIRNIWSMLQANQELIRKYIDGIFDKNDLPLPTPEGEPFILHTRLPQSRFSTTTLPPTHFVTMTSLTSQNYFFWIQRLSEFFD